MVFAWVSIKLIEFLGSDSIDRGSLSSVEPINDNLLSSYLMYFFIALGVPTFEIFLILFGIIFIFIYHIRTSYFNPIFLIFGFNFYVIINNKNIKISIITKKQIKDPTTVSFAKLKRINNYTFVDLEV